MPRDAGGNYVLPNSNPVSSGQIIDVNWANPTLVDIALQLNNVYTRDGVLGPLGPFAVIDGSAPAPALTFITEPALGFFRESAGVLAVAAAGSVIARLTKANGLAIDKLGVTGAIASGGAISGASTSVTGNSTVGGNESIAGTLSVGGAPAAFVPTGTIIDYAGGITPPPAGYLECNGQAVSRATYPQLFTTIGGIYGAGNGSTTFNLPDLRRYVTIGAGGTQDVAGLGCPPTLGSKGGQEVNTLTTSHLPTHSHYIPDPGHAHSIYDIGHAHGVSDPGHAHNIQHDNFSDTAGNGISGSGRATGGTWATDGGGTGITIAVNGTGIGIYGAFTGLTNTNNTGSSESFTNMPKTMAIFKLIKT